MCRNGRYTEHGIKELDGFLRERYRIDPRYAVKLDPALELQRRPDDVKVVVALTA
jgi:glucose 1-dehydrogenase